MSEKIIRDPVHDVIAFRLERPTDHLLFRLINTAEFQRLRRIRQLGMANLAYPGAEHSRYSHSLGVMETARKVLAQLGRSFYLAEEDQLVCLCAALLHDLGHGPFSHVFERITGVHHESLTYQTVLDEESEVNAVLRTHAADLPQRVIAIMSGKPKRDHFCDLISSQLDADRLDYLLRDNLMTGSQYGNYDLSWLVHAFTIDDKTNRLVVSWKGVSAVEAYLQSRYHMYRNVYFHKVVRSGEGMVRLMLQRARRLAVQQRLPWPPKEDPVSKALLGQRLSIGEFLDLDDVSVTHCFKIWQNADDPVLAALCRGLLFRGLFKTIDLTRVTDAATAAHIVSDVSAAITAAGGEPAYEMFFDEPADTPYQTDDAGEPVLGNGITVREPDGSLVNLARISPLPEALNKQLVFRRLHVAPQWRETADRIARAAAKS